MADDANEALQTGVVVSGLFALYTALFASHNKTWGSIAAVIVN